MKNKEKTKKQFKDKSAEMRRQNTELEKLEAEHNQAEKNQELVTRILEELNRPIGKIDVIRNILGLFNEYTGFDAVGIRLHEGEDFPYYVTIGFPSEFVEAENYLCARDSNNKLILDSKGNPYWECMCGNIICGRTDPSLPFFTEGGSFWTNRTSKLLATTTEEDRQTRTRNRCNSEGYESVALIPLRSNDEIIGLLQLNDKRPNQLRLEMIQLLEKVGASIGIALSRRQAEEALKLNEERYELAQRAANIGSWDWDIRTNALHWSDRIEPIFGFSKGKFGATYQAFLQCVHPEDRQFVVNSVNACVEEAKDYAIEHRIVWPDGTVRWVSETGDVIRDENGKAIRMLGVVQDITERKRAEEEIRKSERKFSTIFESIPGGILIMDQDRRVQAINKVLERTFGISRAEVFNKLTGDALRCIHAFETPEGCGYSDYCQSCQIRNTALEALAGNHIYRNKSRVELLVDGKVQEMVLLVSAAPIEYEGKKQAIVILEDITELNQLRQRLKTEQSFAGIIGRDVKILELFDTIKELAEANVPVLIQGESGTGKELVASALHNEGPRAGKQFVPVNCGALPDGLLESELFGHVKGAFTGAIRDKKGRFELADGGTIFFDEVGDLSPAMQVKLLRVLQTGCFERVGGEKTTKVDVRVISATNKSLEKEIAAGRFRDDLYYRLCVVPITMPPLRERISDIPILTEHFLDRAAKESGHEIVSLSSEALAMLMDYKWPGNVRELQNALQFSLVKCHGQVIEPQHLPPTIRQPDKIRLSRRRRRRKLEPKAVADALRQTQGNRLKAAKLLGVSRATLHRFLAEEKSQSPDS